MGYFPVRYVSRVVIYARKMFIRLATGPLLREYLFWVLFIFQQTNDEKLYSYFSNMTTEQPFHKLPLYYGNISFVDTYFPT